MRLALVLMILWNVFVLWYSFKSIYESRSSTVSLYLELQSDCMKNRPYVECRAEYDKATGGYSQWTEFKKGFTPLSIAIVELLPPVTIGIVWGLIWGTVAAIRWVLRGFGIHFTKPTEPREPVPVTERFRAVARWLIAPKNLVALSAGLVALAVSYYFLVSLPASNRERFQFEKDKAEAAQMERDKKEEAAKQAVEDRRLAFQGCESDATTTYWEYVKLNGKAAPGKPGIYTAPMFVWNTADKRKADALAECHRQYDK